MRFPLTLVLLLLASNLLIAQEQKDTNYAEYYRMQYARVYKAYAQNPDDVANLMAMAEFYSSTNNPMRNLPMAMRYVQKAEKNYVAMIDDRDRYKEVSRLIRNKITLAAVRQKKQSIIEETRVYVAGNNTLPESEINLFKEVFSSDAIIMREVERHRYMQAFDMARQANSLAGYYYFLKKHGGTSGAEYAEAEINKIMSQQFADITDVAVIDSMVAPYSDCQYIMTMAGKYKSRMAYADASAKHTVAAYRDFLTKYPMSDEYVEAIDKMESLLEVEFAALKTPRQYADFALRNSDNTLSELAVDRLRSMIVKDRNMAALKIYMEEFPLDSAYGSIYRQSYQWHSDEGNGAPIRAFKAAHPDCPFRVKVDEDMVRAMRADTIDLLRKVAERDVPQYEEYTRMLTGMRVSYVALQRTLQPFIEARNWKRAVDQMQHSGLVFEDQYNDLYEDLRALLLTPSEKVKAVVSELTSTAFDVLHPAPSPDGKRLYYTRRDPDGKCTVCFSEQSGKGGWRYAGPVAFLNTENNGLMFYGIYEEGTKMLLGQNGDIVIAQLEQDGQWRIAEVPPFPVNSDYIETDAFMLPDGTGILLASDRPGGHNYQRSGAYFHGDTALATDLYFVPRTDYGWGEAVNLGLAVNTPYSERSPVLSRDMRTLYFITDAQGLGYGDIYVARRPDVSSWTTWSAPVNMGRDVNTAFNEASVSLSDDERKLFVSASVHGGNYACRSVGLTPASASFYRMATVVLASLHDKTPLAQVDIVDRDAQLMRYNFMVDDFSKPLSASIHKDKAYLVYATAGTLYVPVLAITPDGNSTVFVKGYMANELVKDSVVIPMYGVGFADDSRSLLPYSSRCLTMLAEFLSRNAGLKVEFMVNVQGSDDTQCYSLSLDRGRELKKALTGQGVPASAVSVSAYGNVHYKAQRAPQADVMLRFYKDEESPVDFR